MTLPLSAPPILAADTLRGGAMFSLVLKRGMTLRLIAMSEGTNVSALLFNAEQTLERYNMPDTLKAQHTAYLTQGHVLYSDMGRILVSLAEDTCGWHDTLGGTTDAKLTAARFGDSSYQKDRNAFYRNGRDNFLVELGKYGLGKRDLGPNVNFFSKVWVDDQGGMHYVEGHAKPGQYVDLRAEMHTLVVLSNTPHPLNQVTTYDPPPVGWQLRLTGMADVEDVCRLSCPENGRGYQNTEAYYV
jgi:uncharacterized protein